MKPANTKTTTILLGTVAAFIATVACSNNPKPAAHSSQPDSASVRPVALEADSHSISQPVPAGIASKTPSPLTLPASKLIAYKSRDYGVSFLYPWQYSFVSARAVAHGDPSLRPKPDGHNGQVTLARIEIPKGFYPDTDLDTGYFTLSLNQDIGEEECQSGLSPDKDAKVQTKTIDGVDFHWIATDAGGHGSAEKQRNYAAYANGTCYELETGVKTKNDGLAREVDPDQVLRRLDAILATVKILPATQNSPAPKVETSTAMPPSDSQK